jgi:hypothetical protein
MSHFTCAKVVGSQGSTYTTVEKIRGVWQVDKDIAEEVGSDCKVLTWTQLSDPADLVQLLDMTAEGMNRTLPSFDQLRASLVSRGFSADQQAHALRSIAHFLSLEPVS